MYSYEDRTEVEEPATGECYCHLSMHSSAEGHSQRPCHHCEEDVRREWPEMFEPEPPHFDPIEISPLEVIELEEWRPARSWPERDAA